MATQIKKPIKPVDQKADALFLRAHYQSEAGKHRSAFRLLLSAAKLGESYAQMSLGYVYDLGIGVKRNRAAAMRWYMRAYRQGNMSAANNIGTIHRDEGDSKRALRWFERAVALGDVDASFEIARMFLREKDKISKALPFLRRVMKGRPGLTVTIHSYEQAQRLLKKHAAKKK